jgi:hypothetical protein
MDWDSIERWREEDRQREESRRQEEDRRREELRRRCEEEARRRHLEAAVARLILAGMTLIIMWVITAPVMGLFWPAVFAPAIWFLAEAIGVLLVSLRKKGEEILQVDVDMEEGETLDVVDEEGPHPQMHEDFYFEPEERLEEYGDEAGP